MAKRALVAVAIGSVVLSAACSSTPDKNEPGPSSSSPSVASSSESHDTPKRDLLNAIPQGPPPKLAWYRDDLITLDGGSRRVRLDAPHPNRITGIVAYRGGYLASALGRLEQNQGGLVFDAKGKLLRRLDCMTSPESSHDGVYVAWTSCSGKDWILRVGPTVDLPAPDREQALPEWPAIVPGPQSVDERYVTLQLSQIIRGYTRGAVVVDSLTGELRRLPETNVVNSVSPRRIASVQNLSGTKFALIDLQDNTVVRRSPRPIMAWSPDGRRGLMSRTRLEKAWDVVNTQTGKVLRHIDLPRGLSSHGARWEDSRNLLIVVSRGNFSTMIRVTPTGAIERVARVVGADAIPGFL